MLPCKTCLTRTICRCRTKDEEYFDTYEDTILGLIRKCPELDKFIFQNTMLNQKNFRELVEFLRE